MSSLQRKGLLRHQIFIFKIQAVTTILQSNIIKQWNNKFTRPQSFVKQLCVLQNNPTILSRNHVYQIIGCIYIYKYHFFRVRKFMRPVPFLCEALRKLKSTILLERRICIKRFCCSACVECFTVIYNRCFFPYLIMNSKFYLPIIVRHKT